jgi:hypothetical protein
MSLNQEQRQDNVTFFLDGISWLSIMMDLALLIGIAVYQVRVCRLLGLPVGKLGTECIHWRHFVSHVWVFDSVLIGLFARIFIIIYFIHTLFFA